MLDVSGNYATLTTLLPRSATSTTIVSDYLLPPEVIADASLAGAVQELVDFNETVTAQDAAVVERTQRGISSRAFERGVYPDKDAALFAFNQRYRSLVNSIE
jgi:Rieske 2Fe-2S family protein